MAGNVIKNIAQKALGEAKKFKTVPPHVLEAAARIVNDGGGSKQDEDTLRQYYGYARSGASAAKKYARGVTSAINNVTAYGGLLQNLEIANERGSGSAQASAAIAQKLFGDFENFAKDKGLEKLAKKTSAWLGKDPQFLGRYVRAAARVARLAGTGIQIAQYGFSVAEALVGGRSRLGKATAGLKDVNRQFDADPRMARALEARSREAIQGRSFFRTGNVYGADKVDILKEYLDAGVAEETLKAQQAALATQRLARNNAKGLGIDPLEALARYARGKGKGVAELSETEKNEALDNAVAAGLQGLRNSQGAQEYVASELRKRGYLEEFTDAASDSKGHLQGRSAELAEEFVRKRVLALDKLRSAGTNTYAEIEARLTPAERLTRRRELEFSRAGAAAYRSRHKAVWTD